REKVGLGIWQRRQSPRDVAAYLRNAPSCARRLLRSPRLGCLLLPRASSASDETQLLIEWGKGNEAARDQLMPLVYGELHRMASRYMGTQNPGHTLQTTALIHEAYVRLTGDDGKQWSNRAHFLAVAAKSMRHILVDHARA